MSSSLAARATLDLNDRDFLEDLFVLDKNEKVQIIKVFEKISKLTWAQIYQDAGLKWEKIDRIPPRLISHLAKNKQLSLYSIRVTQAKRAVVTRDGEFMRFLALPPDHDSTYA
jgi:hypothetical protein